MGMQNTVKIAMEFKRLGLFEQLTSVIDMGAQEIHMNHEEFQFLMNYGGISYNKEDFPKLKNYPNGPRQKTKPFWKALGFDNARSYFPIRTKRTYW